MKKITKAEFIRRVMEHRGIAHNEVHGFWHFSSGMNSGHIEYYNGEWHFNSFSATQPSYVMKEDVVKKHIWNKRKDVWDIYTGEWYARKYL